MNCETYRKKYAASILVDRIVIQQNTLFRLFTMCEARFSDNITFRSSLFFLFSFKNKKTVPNTKVEPK